MQNLHHETIKSMSSPTRRFRRASVDHLSSISERRSSRPSLGRKAIHPLPLAQDRTSQTVASRGQSTSPIRSAVASQALVSPELRKPSSRTFVRAVKPTDILDVPKLSHPRLTLQIQVSAPLFVGGATVEGQVYVIIDEGRSTPRCKSRPPIYFSQITIDVLGVEGSLGKESIFQALATELIDDAHPPPSNMIAFSKAESYAIWEGTPSSTILPFRLDLPVNMGPPPYRSRDAYIKYLLCATVALKASDQAEFVRTSREIAILTVHDRMFKDGYSSEHELTCLSG